MERISPSDERTETIAEVEFFYVKIDDHVEYIEQETLPGGKLKRTKCRTLACCRNSKVGNQSVVKGVASHNNTNFGDGYWGWLDDKPSRESFLPGFGPCDGKMDEAMLCFRNEAGNLQQRLDELSAVTDSLNLTDENKRVKDLANVKHLAKKHGFDVEFVKRANLLFHGAKVLVTILKGLEKLDKQNTEASSTFCELITKRKHKDDDLFSTFEGAAAKASGAGMNKKWLFMHAVTARKVRREEKRQQNEQTDGDLSENGSSREDSDEAREERMPSFFHLLVDKLVPYLGGAAAILYAAIKAYGCVFYDTRREILDKEIPALVQDLCGRLKNYDFSKFKGTIQIECPMTYVSWGMKKSFQNVCILIHARNVALLKLDRHQQLNELEELWDRKVQDEAWTTKSDEEKSREKGSVERDASKSLEFSLAYLREKYPPGFEKQDNTTGERSGCTAPVNLLSPAMDILAGAAERVAAERAEQALFYPLTQDSGYVTEVASSSCNTRHVWPGTQPLTEASSSRHSHDSSDVFARQATRQEWSDQHTYPVAEGAYETEQGNVTSSHTGHIASVPRRRLPSHAPMSPDGESSGPIFTDSRATNTQSNNNEVHQGFSEHTQSLNAGSQSSETHKLVDEATYDRQGRSKRQRTVPPNQTMEAANGSTPLEHTLSVGGGQSVVHFQPQLPLDNSETFFHPTNLDIDAHAPVVQGAETETIQHEEDLVNWDHLGTDVQSLLGFNFDAVDFGVFNE